MDFIFTHRLYIAAGCAAGLFTLGVYRKIKAAGSVDEALQNIYVKHIKEDLKSKLLDLFSER